MLQNTFCHLPGINLRAERRIWTSGLRHWEQTESLSADLPKHLAPGLVESVAESRARLDRRDARYFSEALPSDQMWRMFPEFRDSIAYLDIETNGLNHQAVITTIAVYDGRRVRHYVNGQNLDAIVRDIREYRMLVTYNGKAFDAPFIERYFGIRLDMAHLDLMYLLRRLGYTGGLKGCEKKLGIDRGELTDVNGYFAVLLWQDYLASRNDKTLETLLAYNVEDVLNLETLLVKAYNLKLRGTPFENTHCLPERKTVPNPFQADTGVISRIRHHHRHTWY
ncbi:MAG: ribonuclease H-like domain-containing protein [Blastocatellia bacterium]